MTVGRLALSHSKNTQSDKKLSDTAGIFIGGRQAEPAADVFETGA